jgi:hypothetical protein
MTVLHRENIDKHEKYFMPSTVPLLSRTDSYVS